MRKPRTRHVITIMFIIMVLTFTCVMTEVWPKPNLRAVLFMGFGAILIWIVLGGSLMYRCRDQLAHLIQKIPWSKFWTFYMCALLLFMLEEAVMTTMTNLAPVFGVPLGAAYITASPNYFLTLVTSSLPPVGLLILLFSWIFVRFRLIATQMFFIFGIAGWGLEVINMPKSNALNAPFDIFVYGLMVWLPAYALTRRLDQTQKRL